MSDIAIEVTDSPIDITVGSDDISITVEDNGLDITLFSELISIEINEYINQQIGGLWYPQGW